MPIAGRLPVVLPGLADLLAWVVEGAGVVAGACLAVAPLCGAAIGAGVALNPSDVGGAAADDPDLYAQEHPNAVYAKNQQENKAAKRAADKAGLNRQGRDALHREISNQGYTDQEIEGIAQELYDNYPKYRQSP
jgi:hypothetical protein